MENGNNLYEIRRAQMESEQFLVQQFFEKENHTNKEEFKATLNEKREIFDKNNQVIEKQLESQKRSIVEKLKVRKERSMSRSRLKDSHSQTKRIDSFHNLFQTLQKKASDDYFG